ADVLGGLAVAVDDTPRDGSRVAGRRRDRRRYRHPGEDDADAGDRPHRATAPVCSFHLVTPERPASTWCGVLAAERSQRRAPATTSRRTSTPASAPAAASWPCRRTRRRRR